MRELEFRGRRKDNGEWVYGSLCIRKIARVVLIMVEHEDGTATNYPVVPETVGQLLAFTDKNGEPVYEGDIMKVASYRYRIEWDSISARFLARPLRPMYQPIAVSLSKCRMAGQVVGNISENPELL
ncbi:YopX family protein [Streptomyces sp. NPDC056401]|uniref:YopX family protein n=1 Tax=Streptomyces sp. NPDC056401 TaxID=3345809 RepID=UPI0035DAF975